MPQDNFGCLYRPLLNATLIRHVTAHNVWERVFISMKTAAYAGKSRVNLGGARTLVRQRYPNARSVSAKDCQTSKRETKELRSGDVNPTTCLIVLAHLAVHKRSHFAVPVEAGTNLDLVAGCAGLKSLKS